MTRGLSTYTTVAETTQEVTLSDSAWVIIVLPLVIVAITGGVAIWQTLSDRRAAATAAQRSANAALFAAALDAVHEYQELPYRIRRRSDVSPMTREELTSRASDVQVALDRHITHLTLVDANVGAAYRTLVHETRKESGGHMTTAWNKPRIAEDADMNLGNAYPRTEAEKSKADCMTVMQEFLDVSATRGRHRRARTTPQRNR